jgi:hypothetical protein
VSFRSYVYNCALIGGWLALLGWALGRSPDLYWVPPFLPEGPDYLVLWQNGLKGLWLGLCVALGLAMVDAYWNLGMAFSLGALARMLTAALVGAVGGLLGGVLGQFLLDWKVTKELAPREQIALLVVGWTVTGILIGFAIAAFDVFIGRLRPEHRPAARRKVLRGTLGGLLGGALGGYLSVLLRNVWGEMFETKPSDELWSPTGMGFVVLGMCIGFLIGLAQVLLKDAWVKVESGFRAGRELLLVKASSSIGRAEGSDIALFGDATVEKSHACIEQHNDRYLLNDVGTPGGTFLNGRRITGPTPLRSGDLIQVGNALLRFSERRKRESA